MGLQQRRDMSRFDIWRVESKGKIIGSLRILIAQNGAI